MMSVEYSSLSKWKVAQNSLQAQNLYLMIMKYIILRESSLIKVKDIVSLLEEQYWKYANITIARKQYFKNNVMNDDLKDMRRRIHCQQESLSVALAHHRSLSIDIVECVQSWRSKLQKDVQLDDVASIYWNGQNYLLKMLHDTSNIFDTQTMWMWLGFDVDSFIIPPNNINPHTERLNRERKFLKWKKKRDDHHTAALKKLMSQTINYRSNSITDRDGYKRNSDVLANKFGATDLKPIPRRGNLSGEGRPGSANDQKMSTSQSAPTLPPINLRSQPQQTQSAADLTTSDTDIAPTGLVALSSRRRSSTRSGSFGHAASKSGDNDDDSDEGKIESNDMLNPDGTKMEEVVEEDDESFDSSSVTSMLSEDTGCGWRELRDTCLPSWDYYFKAKKENLDEDDPFENEEDFWENLDLIEHVVEAAMGYFELFPKKYIVPPVKKSLLQRCRLCERVLMDETILVEKIKEKIATREELKVTFDKNELRNFLRELESESEEALEEKFRDMLKLQQRQESSNIRNHFKLQSIPREYVANLLDKRKPYQRYIATARRKGRLGPPSRSSPSRLSKLPSQNNSPRPMSTYNDFAVFLTTPAISHESQEYTQSTVSFIPENVECKMDRNVLMERMESVVENDRLACIRLGSCLILRASYHRRNKMRAYHNKKSNKRNALEAVIFMQALIRGVLTRNRLKRKNKMKEKMNATLFIQNCLRRYLHRCRERVKRRLFRADCLRVRREILASHRCADIIKTFFRYLIFLRKRTLFLNKYQGISKLDPARYNKVLDGVLRIQRLFRGYIKRRWFFDVIAESRKRSKITRKYKARIIQSSRCQHNFTVAGSGGFKYWWRNAPEKNSVKVPQKVSTITLDTELTLSTTLLTDSAPDHKSGGESFQYTEIPTGDEGVIRQDTTATDFESEGSPPVKDGLMSPSLLSIDSELQSQQRSAIESRKRSNIRGKLAALKAGSTSHHKGINLLRAVPVKDREFIPRKNTAYSTGSVSGDGNLPAPRSYTEAYENPNVHHKAKKTLSDSLSRSLSLESRRSHELNNLLRNVYGFEK